MTSRRPYFAAMRRCRAARPYAIAALLYVAASLAPTIAGDAREVGPPPGLQIAQAPVALDAKTIEKYGTALSLGDRAPQFAPEITAIYQAVQRGDSAAVAAAVQALYAKAKRPVPQGEALAKLMGQLPAPQAAAADATAPPAGLPPPPIPDSIKDAVNATSGTAPDLPLGPRDDAKPPPPSNAAAPAQSPDLATACTNGTADDFSPTKLLGQWSDGQRTVHIRRKDFDGRAFTLRDKFVWDGTLDGHKLKFSRKPTADEIDPKIPDWARKMLAAQGLEWTIELEAKLECGKATLEGAWYAGKVELKQQEDASGHNTGQSVTIIGKGDPYKLKFERPGPAIAHAIVLEDQSEFADSGRPAWPYPFWKGASATPADATRTLFVYGRGLPRSWSDKMELKSSDPAIHYIVTAISVDDDEDPAMTKLNPRDQEQLAKGWQIATLNLDEPTKQFIKGMDALILRVNFDSGALPGKKEFTLNGLDTDWLLTFGDTMAGMSFMREVTEDIADPTTELILPEQTFLQIQTAVPLPVPSIELRVHINKEKAEAAWSVAWNGARTLTARRISDTVYRTDRIELYEAGRPAPPKTPGFYALGVQVGDQIYVEPDDPYLLAMTPGVLKAKVLRTPAELGETWKEALERAARDAGVPEAEAWYRVDDDNHSHNDAGPWSQLSAAKAAEIRNRNWTSLSLKVLNSPLTELVYLTTTPFPLSFYPIILRAALPHLTAIDPLLKGKFVETVDIKVGDLAALYLLSDEFVRRTKDRIENLKSIQGDAALRALRLSLKPNALNADSEWTHIRVTCPSGGASDGCPYSYALFDEYLKKMFGDDWRKRDKWTLDATKEAVAKLIQAAEASVAKVEGLTGRGPQTGLIGRATDAVVGDSTADKSQKLLDVLGYTYAPLVPTLNARMMRLGEIGSPPRQLWVPDLNGRYELRNLHLLYDAVIAQKNYAELDRTFFVQAVGAMAGPFLSGESAIMEAIGWTAEVGQFVIPLSLDIKDAVRQREDLKVALGASLVLGTQLLDQQELAKTEWFQIALNNIPGALQSSLRTYRVVGIVRGHLAMPQVEAGGLKALQAMSEANQDAFWRFVTEAKLLEEGGHGKAISAMHRRAINAANKLLQEMNLPTPTGRPVVAPIEAVGAPSAPAPRSAEPALPQVPPEEQTTVVVKRTSDLPETAKLPATDTDLPKTAKLRATDSDLPKTATKPQAKPEGPETAPKPETKPERPETATKPQAKPEGPETAAKPETTPEPPETVKRQKTAILDGFDDPMFNQKIDEGQSFLGFYNGRLKAFKLGKRVGKGVYANVFELLDAESIPGCEQGCVIKIYQPDQRDWFFPTGNGTVDGAKYINGLLAPDPQFPEIPQLRNVAFGADSQIPYLIQAKAGPKQIIFRGPEDFSWARAAEPKLGPAVTELVRRLKLRGLHMEDFKVSNLFFEQTPDGEWVAGIVDFDRIVPWGADRAKAPNNLGAWLGYCEARLWPKGMEVTDGGKKEILERAASLADVTSVRLPDESDRALLQYFQEHPGPYYRDIDLTWEKTMEVKGFIKFDAKLKRYVDGMLKVEEVEKVLPRLNDPERLKPFDASRPFAKPDTIGYLRLVPSESASPPVALASAWTESMRMAA